MKVESVVIETHRSAFKVGKVYLAGPPEGHKVALPGAAVSISFQPNITSCINLQRKISLFIRSLVEYQCGQIQTRTSGDVGTLHCMIILATMCCVSFINHVVKFREPVLSF